MDYRGGSDMSATQPPANGEKKSMNPANNSILITKSNKIRYI